MPIKIKYYPNSVPPYEFEPLHAPKKPDLDEILAKFM